MKGKVYMNQKIICVRLMDYNQSDVLSFVLDENKPEEYIVNLNDADSQQALKHVFSKLLNMLIETDIELSLEIDDDYTKGLYKDVCSEYIVELNKELQEVKKILNESI